MAHTQNSQTAGEPNPARAAAVLSLSNLRVGIGVVALVGIINGVIVPGPV